METVHIKVSLQNRTPKELPYGGTNPTGTQLGVNTVCFTRNGRPWYPVMGEFHYSRCPESEWETELQKIRAGGVEIVSTYVFWIHHEEIKGEWDFTGQRNLRRFLQLCQQTGLMVWLRIGPWVHAEARNGGFPDWLQQDKSIHLRSNDARYLQEVKRFYEKIMEQAQGMLFKDGGPVIGIQIENEYGHCGGEQGETGMQHMRTLKELAQKIGLDVPFYTATGWGGANVVDGEMLPVQGGYADAPWEPTDKALPPNVNYLISPCRNDALIGSDWGKAKETFIFRVEDTPFLTAELGGGLQVTAKRRPVVSGADTAALALCKVASGANLLGYYMYHGGTNPVGKCTTLQESKATGSYTDVPVLSYDFQAPVGEYGELYQSYRKLKNLHLFLREFGELLAPAECVFPPEQVTNAEDTGHLRFSVRWNQRLGGGFLFVNNHQRLRRMAAHKVVFQIECNGQTVVFPEMHFADHDYGIYPCCLPLGDAVLESTNAQLLCRLRDKYVFVCGEKPIFHFRKGSVQTLVLTPAQAENVWKFGDTLYLTEGELFREGHSLRLTTEKVQESVRMLPEGKTWTAQFHPKKFSCSVEIQSEKKDCSIYVLSISVVPDEECPDAMLELRFTGGRAALYNEDGEMEADWFVTGRPWRVSLRRLGFPTKLVLKLFADTDSVYYEYRHENTPRLQQAKICPKYSMLLPESWM